MSTNTCQPSVGLQYHSTNCSLGSASGHTALQLFLPILDNDDRYSTKAYRITTAGHHGDRHTARVQTYGDVIEAYEYHPEAKCADVTGQPCGKQTVGLLQRRHVWIDLITPIPKRKGYLLM